MLAWESFGKVWVTDVVSELKLENARVLEADFGHLPNLGEVDFARDVIFTANGTTSGVRIPNYDWIAADRKGLTLVDATSAVFAQPVDWSKVDVLTYSWQKVLGGEAAHGMLILGPRAVEQIESRRAPRPLPKLFRMTKGGKVDLSIFEGDTINTPSMLCVEDYLDALGWAESAGGLRGLIARADANARVLHEWIARTPWVENLAVDRATWSNTSICLKVVAPRSRPCRAKRRPPSPSGWPTRSTRKVLQKTSAPTATRRRGSASGPAATVERADLEALTPWLDWAFAHAKAALGGRLIPRIQDSRHGAQSWGDVDLLR